MRMNATPAPKWVSIKKHIKIVKVADIHEVKAAFQPAVKLLEMRERRVIEKESGPDLKQEQEISF